MTDEVLDPFGEPSVERHTELATRLTTVAGSTIGLFSNSKKNADHFLRALGARLEAEHDVEVSDVIYKEMSPSAAEPAVYDRLREYDGVIIAYGDCGSCSSWTIHDALQLETSGTPTVVFCTEEFTTLCQYESENQGAPGLPIVALGHPVATLDPETIASERVTDGIVASAVASLTSDPEALLERFGGRYTDARSDEAVPDGGR